MVAVFCLEETGHLGPQSEQTHSHGLIRGCVRMHHFHFWVLRTACSSHPLLLDLFPCNCFLSQSFSYWNTDVQCLGNVLNRDTTQYNTCIWMRTSINSDEQCIAVWGGGGYCIGGRLSIFSRVSIRSFVACPWLFHTSCCEAAPQIHMAAL